MKKFHICKNCGHRGDPKKYVPGHFIAELILWLMFLLPGLLYTVWRLAKSYKGCPQCGAPYMIPSDSPAAKG